LSNLIVIELVFLEPSADNYFSEKRVDFLLHFQLISIDSLRGISSLVIPIAMCQPSPKDQNPNALLDAKSVTSIFNHLDGLDKCLILLGIFGQVGLHLFDDDL